MSWQEARYLLHMRKLVKCISAQHNRNSDQSPVYNIYITHKKVHCQNYYIELDIMAYEMVYQGLRLTQEEPAQIFA